MRPSEPEIRTASSRSHVADDQRRLRPTAPIRELSEYLSFLGEIEDVFGPTEKPRRIADGDRFLL